MKNKLIYIFLLIVIGVAGGYFYNTNRDTNIEDFDYEFSEFHEHADVKIYLEGVSSDLAQDKYQTTHERLLDFGVHLHDNSGILIHTHKPNINLGYFFNTIGMKFIDDCFILDTGEEYCNKESEILKMYVNGVRSQELSGYVFSDLDRILITYGDEIESEIIEQQESVTNDSCIFSLKCPERGDPPEEGCGADTGCPALY